MSLPREKKFLSHLAVTLQNIEIILEGSIRSIQVKAIR